MENINGNSILEMKMLKIIEHFQFVFKYFVTCCSIINSQSFESNVNDLVRGMKNIPIQLKDRLTSLNEVNTDLKTFSSLK